jgi:hypothetical protein
VAKTLEFQRVSDQLQQTLDREVSKPLSDRRDEVATLMNSERLVATYNACIWWDGCYYCKDDMNSWYCVKCCFF